MYTIIIQKHYQMGCCETKSNLRSSGPRTIIPQTKQYDLSSPLIESYDCEAAFGDDCLEQVDKNKMSQKLHKNLGALIFTSAINQAYGKGTGLLISSDLVLTCAHNLYNKQTGELYRDFQFYPGQYGELKRYITVDDFYFPSKYHLSRLPAYQYALLKLSEKVQNSDFIELGGQTAILKDKDSIFSIYGYPQTAYSTHRNDKFATTQFGMSKKDRIIEVREVQGELIHRLSTVRGMSGAPIICEDSAGKMTIVGIHVGAMVSRVDGIKKRVNVGRLMTSELIDTLKKAAINLNAQMFKIPAGELGLPANDSTLISKTLDFLDETQDLLINHSKFQTRDSHSVATNAALIDNIFKQAYSLYFDGKLSQTIQKYRTVINLDPTNAAAFHNMALAFNDQKQYNQAIKCYEKAIEIDPKYASAYNNLGNTYDKIKQTQKAIDCYRKAIEYDPTSAKAYNNLGSALRDLKQYHEAVTYYKKAIQLDRNYQKAKNNLQGVQATIDEIVQIRQKISFLQATLQRDPQNQHVKTKLPELKQKLKLMTK